MGKATTAVLASQDLSKKQFRNDKSMSLEEKSLAVLIHHECEKVFV